MSSLATGRSTLQLNESMLDLAITLNYIKAYSAFLALRTLAFALLCGILLIYELDLLEKRIFKILALSNHKENKLSRKKRSMKLVYLSLWITV